MRKIPVKCKDGFTKHIIVDDGDFERAKSVKWALGGQRGVTISGWEKASKRTVQIGRFILGEDRREFHVDHINRDPFDNRRSNLRVCTPQQNHFNRAVRKNSVSGFKGVSFEKGKWWAARLKYGESRLFLGFFKEKEDAARAYNEKAKELFGEFAWLNPV